MALELITGKKGTPHISSNDVRAFNRSIFGAGNYRFVDEDDLIVTPNTGANTLTIATGSCLWSGMHIRNATAITDFSYGSPVNNTMVYLWLHYTKGTVGDISNVENVEFVTSLVNAPPNSGVIKDELADTDTDGYTLFYSFRHLDSGATNITYAFAETSTALLDAAKDYADGVASAAQSEAIRLAVGEALTLDATLNSSINTKYALATAYTDTEIGKVNVNLSAVSSAVAAIHTAKAGWAGSKLLESDSYVTTPTGVEGYHWIIFNGVWGEDSYPTQAVHYRMRTDLVGDSFYIAFPTSSGAVGVYCACALNDPTKLMMISNGTITLTRIDFVK